VTADEGCDPTIDSDRDGVNDCSDIEECDLQDNDGNGQIDEGFDSDSDGIQDCLDVEECDEVDNDGDGLFDEAEECPGRLEWYPDEDGDGFGVEDDTVFSTVEPEGYADNSDDCNDGDASIHPDAEEVCDEIDNNCDGSVDEDLDCEGGAVDDSDADTGDEDADDLGDADETDDSTEGEESSDASPEDSAPTPAPAPGPADSDPAEGDPTDGDPADDVAASSGHGYMYGDNIGCSLLAQTDDKRPMLPVIMSVFIFLLFLRQTKVKKEATFPRKNR